MKWQKFFGASVRDSTVPRQSVRVFGATVFAALLITTNPALALDDTCDRVARIAANESGVPLEVLMAITRTETGRRSNGVLAPWPWTVNMEGLGKWFATRKEAQAFAMSGLNEGKRSFDVGCFQLNYRWHGQHFRDVEHMFEPLENARYAADFLSRLYGELQSWDSAAAAYHSRTPKYADKYKARYKQILASLPEPPKLAVVNRAHAAVTETVRVNAFPLLRKGSQAAGMGSLVPLGAGSARPLFGGS